MDLRARGRKTYIPLAYQRALNSQSGIMQSSNLQTHYLRSGKTRCVIEPENHTEAGDGGGGDREDESVSEGGASVYGGSLG